MTNVSRPDYRYSYTNINDLSRNRRSRVGLRIRAHLPLELHRTIDRYVNTPRRGARYSQLHLRSIRQAGFINNGGDNPLFTVPANIAVRAANNSTNRAIVENIVTRQMYLYNQRHLRAQIRSGVGRRLLSRIT